MGEFAQKLGSDCEGVQDLQRLFDLIAAYGISDWIDFDASVVRGLSYYTGVVFEGFDRSGELRAICGGGRYDTLLESFGGDAVPAVGFGFGDAVIMELLATKELVPDFDQAEVEAVVYAMSGDLRPKAMQVASALRAAGVNVDVILDTRKPKWAFARAEKSGAAAMIMLASDEAKDDKVILKNLATREQKTIVSADVVDQVASLL
jgi:histidyl-tRNA synthetase